MRSLSEKDDEPDDEGEFRAPDYLGGSLPFAAIWSLKLFMRLLGNATATRTFAAGAT